MQVMEKDEGGVGEMEKCMAGLVNGLYKWSTRKVRIGKSR